MSPQHAFRRIRVLIDDSLIRTFSQVNITTQCLNQQISDFKFTQFKLSLITIIIQCYFFIWQRLSCLWACLHLCQEQFIQNRKTFDPFVFSLVIQTQVDASSFLFTPSQISWGFTLRNTTQKDIKPLFSVSKVCVILTHDSSKGQDELKHSLWGNWWVTDTECPCFCVCLFFTVIAKLLVFVLLSHERCHVIACQQTIISSHTHDQYSLYKHEHAHIQENSKSDWQGDSSCYNMVLCQNLLILKFSRNGANEWRVKRKITATFAVIEFHDSSDFIHPVCVELQ